MQRAVETEKLRIEANLRFLRMEMCRAKAEKQRAEEAKKQRVEAEWQADLRFLKVEMHRREAERLAVLYEAEVEKQHLTGSEKGVDRRERQRKAKAEKQRVEREEQRLAWERAELQAEGERVVLE